MRFFNTTGPCYPEKHYMLPPKDRLVGAQLDRYIRDELYWVLHAPRQTGKTTFLQSWMREINSSRQALSCYVSVENCQGVKDPKDSMPAICESIKMFASNFDVPVPNYDRAMSPNSQLNAILSDWAKIVAPKSLIVLFDEVDTLIEDTLISFLRQLRGGFAVKGAGKFPISIALVGMRDLKDYIKTAKDGIAPNPGSPFNIKADSVFMANFTKEDIGKLFWQRTEETGQKITEEALNYVYEQTAGQPWLVNSLFARATMRILDENSKETVTIEHIRTAREQMILARETHLDALAVRLKEGKIYQIIGSLMTGEADPFLTQSDDFRYCLDLGLVSMKEGMPTVSNPIYRETLARELTFGMQPAISAPQWKWQKDNGSLDMDALLKEFQKFWRQNADIWEERRKEKFKYTEAFPHLLLQAFLQRVLNGGGYIDREYAAGRGRMDLAVRFKGYTYIIEIKLIYDYSNPQIVAEEGLEQIKEYRDTVDAAAPSYLVIFDRRSSDKKKSWDERLTWRQKDGIVIVGC